MEASKTKGGLPAALRVQAGKPRSGGLLPPAADVAAPLLAALFAAALFGARALVDIGTGCLRCLQHQFSSRSGGVVLPPYPQHLPEKRAPVSLAPRCSSHSRESTAPARPRRRRCSPRRSARTWSSCASRGA